MQPSRETSRVMVVEDDPIERADLARLVASFGHRVIPASNGSEALDRMPLARPSVIVSDLVMPGMDGVELIAELISRGDHTPVIILTGFGTITQAISVVHDLKAFWFLEKPVLPSVLRALLDRAIEQHRLRDQTEALKMELGHHGIGGELVGESAAMLEVASLIRQVAPTNASVLITGESGTGKELVARAIHRLSPRRERPFIGVNCAAWPETLIESELFGHERGAFTGALERHAGCFEQAQTGTLLLDEIADMPIGTQAKLLRVLEQSNVRRLGGADDIPISVRILAATNWQPAAAISKKRLREDLYYRLNVFHIELPPLRDRREDIPLVASALIRELNKKHACHVTGLSPEVEARFHAYPWPGNVRELRNVLERAMILAGEGEIRAEHLSEQFGTVPEPRPGEGPGAEVLRAPVGLPLRSVEQIYLTLVLNYTNQNRRRAADILGIGINTLYNKLRQFKSAERVRAASCG